ncbi:hypothetical protein PGTUg99_033157 [Puccinia graminis f. sp. tritici]|uniref:Uncharacterized protein n=1 Tax=Puccinia graminis f. sp. tritici TaxID=56615 RepID=A0A5B0N5L8_PUCGR|nr:hypothetical protein PGTUg99_033157 [Puccinia graminis f. sp. tritici]
MILFHYCCFGGFMKDPSVQEIVNGFYGKVALYIPPEKQWHVPHGLPMEQHIKRITRQFKASGTHGHQILECVLSISMEEIRLGGKLEWKGLWEKYMLPSSSSKMTWRKKIPLDSHHQLLNSLYVWCEKNEDSMIMRGGYLPMEKIKVLSNLELNKETVEVAINFHTLSMVWKAYNFLWTMVTQMAIYQTSTQFPKLTPIEINEILQHAVEEKLVIKMVKTFCEGFDPTSNKFNQEKEFYNFIRKVFPKPYQVRRYGLPVLDSWVKATLGSYITRNGSVKIK